MGCCFSCINCLVAPAYSSTVAAVTKKQIADSPELLATPLNKVSVMTSHNSYIHTLQIGSVSSTKGLEIALAKGVRCIELDLFREPGRPADVFVAHGREGAEGQNTLVTTKMPLTEALDFLAATAFAKTSDPLFITLQVNCHKEEAACDIIAYLFEVYFGSRLYKGKIKASTLLSDLVGKVILIHGGGVVGEKMLALVNQEWGVEFQNAPYTIGFNDLAIGSSAVRLYPTGYSSDVLSANFDPMPMLNEGATFVALNVCTEDAHMVVYENYFRECSFVKH